jgi:hypothetical protein
MDYLRLAVVRSKCTGGEMAEEGVSAVEFRRALNERQRNMWYSLQEKVDVGDH